MNIGDFIAVNTAMEETVLNDEKVLRVVKANKIMEFDENTYAKRRDIDFHNGVIEVKMFSRLLPDAPDFARGFIGIAFRIRDDDSAFESFYVRPTNSMTDDPVRKAHGCQYFSYFRDNNIIGYEAPIHVGLEEWITLRAVIEEAHADFYINDFSRPVLSVDDLKHGSDAHGSVGLFVDIGTEAFFKELVIRRSL